MGWDGNLFDKMNMMRLNNTEVGNAKYHVCR